MLDTPAGWYPDPWQKAPLRWWDGALWTPFVSPRAVAPLGARAEGAVRPAAPVLPLRAVWLAVGALVAVQLVGYLGLARLGDGLTVFVVAVGLQYGTILAVVAWASHRWGEGGLVHDVGLRFRPADLGWASLAWLGTVVGISRVVLALDALGVPFASNNPFRDSSERYALDAPRFAVLALVGLVLVVGAPFFEELLFRGVVLRGLRSRLPAAPAVAVQGAVFGAFHFEPSRGMGNIGLVIVISGLGVVLGVLAERTGRLGSGMVAHAIQNGLVFAVGVATLT